MREEAKMFSPELKGKKEERMSLCGWGSVYYYNWSLDETPDTESLVPSHRPRRDMLSTCTSEHSLEVPEIRLYEFSL